MDNKRIKRILSATTAFPYESIKIFDSISNESQINKYGAGNSAPFSVKLFTADINPDLTILKDFKDGVLYAKKSLSGDIIKNNFYIFEINDLGNRSASTGQDDIFPICFNPSGYKIHQRNIAYIRSHNSGQIFILIPKSVGELDSITTVINFVSPIESKDRPQSNVTSTTNSFNINNLNLNKINDIELRLNNLKINASNYLTQPKLSNTTGRIIKTQDRMNSYLITNQYTSGIKDFKSGSLTMEGINNAPSVNNIQQIYTLINKKHLNNYIIFNKTNSTPNYRVSSYPGRVNAADIEVYQVTDSSRLTSIKLKEGIDYYINQAAGHNDIIITTPVGEYEIVFSAKRDYEYSVSLTTDTTGAVNYENFIKYVLYETYHYRWDLEEGFNIPLIFSNGLLLYPDGDDITLSGDIEILIGDSIPGGATSPTKPANLTSISLINNPNTFTEYNVNTTLSDRDLIHYGQTIPNQVINSIRLNQEVFLVDKNANYKIGDNEVFIEKSGNTYTVQGFNDPFLTKINDYIGAYSKLQTNDASNNIVNDLLKLNVVQNIEEDMSVLKSNLLAIFNNVENLPSPTTHLNGVINNIRPAFVVLKETTSKTVDITYSGTGIAKTEYGCVINDTYVSLPYFLANTNGTTISNTPVNISVKYSDGSPYTGTIYVYT